MKNFLSIPTFKLNEKNIEILNKIDIKLKKKYFQIILNVTHPMTIQNTINNTAIEIFYNESDDDNIFKILNFLNLKTTNDFSFTIDNNVQPNQFFMRSTKENNYKKNISKEEAIEILFSEYLRLYPASTVFVLFDKTKNHLKRIIVIENVDKNEKINVENAVWIYLNKTFDILNQNFNLDFYCKINIKDYFEIIIDDIVECVKYEKSEKFYNFQQKNRNFQEGVFLHNTRTIEYGMQQPKNNKIRLDRDFDGTAGVGYGTVSCYLRVKNSNNASEDEFYLVSTGHKIDSSIRTIKKYVKNTMCEYDDDYVYKKHIDPKYAVKIDTYKSPYNPNFRIVSNFFHCIY
jgi:hypothetical protein